MKDPPTSPQNQPPPPQNPQPHLGVRAPHIWGGGFLLWGRGIKRSIGPGVLGGGREMGGGGVTPHNLG